MQNRIQFISFYLILFLCTVPLRAQNIITAAQRTQEYFGYIQNKNCALVVNHSSFINQTHLADSLLRAGIKVKKIFAPEHGFRGDHADGAHIKSDTDKQSNLPLISLYGKHHKPTPTELKGIDIVIFDIQDVGARFYTYLSTLHYVMEACAENNIEVMVLDRPNPNGFYIDGPVLDTAKHNSFVGMHPVPVVYGMTIGEYALMINGEGWLKSHVRCRLKVIPLLNYTHDSTYLLPIWPSPNLASMEAIYLYPSLCLFEGTQVSVGRGTPNPFQVIGAPWFNQGDLQFTPQPIKGKSDNPPLKGQLCKGLDLRADGKNLPLLRDGLNLNWLIEFYKAAPDKSGFFIPYFEKLAGTRTLREQIIAGVTADQIKQSWTSEISEFKKIRSKYLLYN